jgi:gluconokinase
MPEPLILALDIGTSSSRAMFFDIAARRVGPFASQHHHPLLTSPDGKAEIEPGALLGAARSCITEMLHRRRADGNLRARPIGAIGMSCFSHGLVGCTEKGEAITRIIAPGDTRCRDAAAVLRKRFDEKKIHARTGCMLRTAFWPAKMAWLRRIEPRLFDRVRQWMSPAEWLQLRLAGDARCAIGMASSTGLFDPAALKWDAGMVKSADLSLEKLRPLGDEPTPVGGPFAQEFQELRGVPWFPGIGDSAAVTLGCGASHAGLAAFTIGESAALQFMRDGVPTAPFGLACHRVDGRRHIVGASLANAGNLRTWCLRELRLTDGPELDAALAARPGPQHGLAVLPFWNTEGAPSWNEDSAGAIHGIRQSTTALDILQAVTEATCHRIALVAELAGDGHAAPKIIFSSDRLRSASALERIANVLGRPIYPSDEPEPASRGAAVFALEKLGYPIPPQKLINPVKPRKAAAREYAIERERQRKLEELL